MNARKSKHTAPKGHLKLRKYWAALTRQEREDLARRMNTTYGTINNLSYDHGSCSARFAIELDRETKGEVPAEDSCPDADWNYIRATAKKKNRSGHLKHNASAA